MKSETTSKDTNSSQAFRVLSLMNVWLSWLSCENFVACCWENWLHCQKFLRICGFHLLSTPVKPFFWKCYVDDVISAVSGNEAERLLSHLNSVEPSVQFTLEREKDRNLPFLDLNVSRGVQGNLETSVYRKPTHTDKYLEVDAHHPICHKKSVAKTYLRGLTVFHLHLIRSLKRGNMFLMS